MKRTATDSGSVQKEAMASTKHKDFEDVALRHVDAVYGMARRLSADDTEADDLVQETFMRAYRAFSRFELREYGAKPWLLKILHNVFFTRRGREHRQPTLLDDADFDHFAGELESPSLEALSDGKVDWDQFDEELKEAVNLLGPEYRSVILLWSLEELSYREIAEVCDCPIGTVMSRLYRARQQLGQRLADYAVENKIATERFS